MVAIPFHLGQVSTPGTLYFIIRENGESRNPFSFRAGFNIRLKRKEVRKMARRVAIPFHLGQVSTGIGKTTSSQFVISSQSLFI